MSLLNNIQSSETSKQGIRAVIAGCEKIGKTTLISGAPGNLLIPLEIGYSGVKVQHVPMIKEYSEFVGLLADIITQLNSGKGFFKSISIDSATALERLIEDSILQLDPSYRKGASKTVSMETALGGYGRANALARIKFKEVLDQLDIIASFDVNVLFTCHVFASKVVDPQVGEYDMWDLLLHSPKNQKTYGVREYMTQWADLIGFLYEPIIVSESNGISRGIDAKKGRMLGLSKTPGYVAGNRFGIEGEISIPKEQGWNYLAHAIHQSKGIDVFNRNI